jgi:hypothetical protein
MRGTRRSAALAAVMAAAVIGAAAPAAQAALAGTGALARQARPATSPAFAGREVFKIYGVRPGPRRPVVTASGAFSAKGAFNRKRATIDFPKGRIIVFRHVLHTSYFGPDLATCRFKIVQSGTFHVARATGRYRGVSETGTFRSTVRARLHRTGPDRCGSHLVAYQAVTYETGTVR